MVLYLDTSVFGGVFDEEFSEESSRLVNYIMQGKITIFISRMVLIEVDSAPEHVKKLVRSLPREQIVFLEENEETDELSEEYIASGVIERKWKQDSMHVALATIHRADAIVSWNFKHIVRLDRIKGYNLVNFRKGYGILHIVSPKEVCLEEE